MAEQSDVPNAAVNCDQPAKQHCQTTKDGRYFAMFLVKLTQGDIENIQLPANVPANWCCHKGGECGANADYQVKEAPVHMRLMSFLQEALMLNDNRWTNNC